MRHVLLVSILACSAACGGSPTERDGAASAATTTAFNAFAANEAWTSNPYYGTRGTSFADVTGDGKADAIVVNDGGVTVRRSNGASFLPNETWTANPYYGTRGTYFADVTGDGKADAIVVNDGAVTVRRSNGTSFLPNETWTANPYYGTRGTYFADVTGDGKADAIVVNDGGVTVRRSNGTSFLPNETWTANPYYGTRGTYFADVTGDGKADAIVVNDGGVTVRRSNGTSFLPNETWTTNPYYGDELTAFADATGDAAADAIVVNSNGPVVVRRATAQAAPPPPPPPPGRCQNGGDGWIAIDEFASEFDAVQLVIGNYVTFDVAITRFGGPGAINIQIDQYPAFTRIIDGLAQNTWTMQGAPRWTASSPTHHTITVSNECMTVTRSFDGQLVQPTVPPATLDASPTYVTVGSAVTLSPNDKSFAFPNCDTQEYTIVGTLAGTNQPAFKATGVTGPITVHPTADTYYTATNTCAFASTAAGTPTSTTSSPVLVTIGPSSVHESYYCFSVTTAGSAAMPPTCWAEAVPAPDEATATAIEKQRNQNATVDSLGQCTSVPTDACE